MHDTTISSERIWTPLVEDYTPPIVNPKGLEPHTVYVVEMNALLKESDISGHDIWRMIASLQGVLNRDFKHNQIALYVIFEDGINSDRFWLDYMSEENRFLYGFKRHTIYTLSEFMGIFKHVLRDVGIVLWDSEVPATSNVAATACGIYNYIPVRYLNKKGSLYHLMLEYDVPVRENFVGRFKGKGMIDDIGVQSTGSAKNDVYYWAVAHYMPKTSPGYLAYYVDGAVCIEENPLFSKESNEGHLCSLPNHDFHIAKRAFFCDLSPAGDEVPCDDSDQPFGTDLDTYKKILRMAYLRNQGKMISNGGHVPWRLKYSNMPAMNIFNGIHSNLEIERIWNNLCSRYNIVADCDASHPAWMTNASLYNQYPVPERFPNNRPPEQEYDPDAIYMMLYVGDYDGSAWFKARIKRLWDSRSGQPRPISWSFDPNLVERCAPMFDFMYNSMSPYDYFTSGNSGAGQMALNELFQKSSPDREMPDGDEAWAEWCEKYFHQFNLDITGLIFGLDHKNHKMLDIYSRFSPVGAFHHNPNEEMRSILYKDTVFAYNDAHAVSYAERFSLEERLERLFQSLDSNLRLGLNYGVFRTVCYSYPMLIELQDAVSARAKELYPDKKIVWTDPYTLLDMIKKHNRFTYLVREDSSDSAKEKEASA